MFWGLLGREVGVVVSRRFRVDVLVCWWYWLVARHRIEVLFFTTAGRVVPVALRKFKEFRWVRLRWNIILKILTIVVKAREWLEPG